MNESYQDKLNKTGKAIKNAEVILIGAGAGLSTSGGLHYGGQRFTSNFPDFIERYNLTDMYSSGFYPFETEEERWAYWSRHIKLNRYDFGPAEVYQNLLQLVRDKTYFVLTTNADAQFEKTGFAGEQIFAVQGDYGKFQCANACHQTLYNNEEMIRQMVLEQHNCCIPSSLVPQCPRCGGFMEPNLRKDQFFVEDDAWHRASKRYQQFVSALDNQSIVLLELGVGYNTPTIIKFPFEQLTATLSSATLIRINKDYSAASTLNSEKTITFNRDIGQIMTALG